MRRNRIINATVLRLRPFGEAKEAFFLSSEEGLVRALVYGGAKSKLRAYVSPFNSGVLYLYRDPARGFEKVVDFDCRSWRPGLRELYERVTAAEELARTVLKGLGGDFEAAKTALDESLDVLEEGNAVLASALVIHFRWRWAGILGIRPELSSIYKDAPDEARRLPPLGEGAAKWLTTAGALAPAEIQRYTMDKEAAAQAYKFCEVLLE